LARAAYDYSHVPLIPLNERFLLTSFRDLGLAESIAHALAEEKYITSTPIQLQTIPVVLSCRDDLIGIAQTGTGKTAGFGLPIRHPLAAHRRRPGRATLMHAGKAQPAGFCAFQSCPQQKEA
jgi:superfamily II DNA/RNA helicase